MLEAHRAEVTERLGEVLTLVEHIRHREVDPPAQDSAEVKILRGLFHVHLYAALEFAVNRGVQRFLQHVRAMDVIPLHMEARFLSVALDATFSSMRNVGEGKSWDSRLKLIELQSSRDPERINESIFDLYLQNVRFEKLKVLFKCLCIDQPVVPDSAYQLYVDELVDRRNGIAHGRFSALGIGSTQRSPDLLIRYNAIADTCLHILSCLEQQHEARGMIHQAHRASYL